MAGAISTPHGIHPSLLHHLAWCQPRTCPSCRNQPLPPTASPLMLCSNTTLPREVGSLCTLGQARTEQRPRGHHQHWDHNSCLRPRRQSVPHLSPPRYGEESQEGCFHSSTWNQSQSLVNELVNGPGQLRALPGPACCWLHQIKGPGDLQGADMATAAGGYRGVTIAKPYTGNACA